MTAPTSLQSDRQLQQQVPEELDRDGRLTPTEIGVDVDDGIVTLTGTVSS